MNDTGLQEPIQKELVFGVLRYFFFLDSYLSRQLKQDIKDKLELQDEKGNWIHNQHGGLKVNSGTFFLDSDGLTIPTWFKSIKEVLQ